MVSPDGSHVGLAGYKGIRRTGLQIYRVADGKPMCKPPAYFSIDSRQGTTDFIGPDRFLAVHTATAGVLVKTWDVKTGVQLGSFNAKGLSVKQHMAVSPGGRYLATYAEIGPDRGVHIYELPGGQLVRKLKPFVSARALLTLQGMAFSHDGKELVTLGTSFEKNTDFLQAWDFETGKRTGMRIFKTRLVLTAENAQFYPVPIEWLPDRSGVLAYGQLMIDLRKGKGLNGTVFWKVPPHDPKISWQRRFVDADHLLTVLPQPPPWHVGVLTLPRDEIAAARTR